MRSDFPLVVIRGAGDLASGVAVRLHRSGFPVVMTEIERPLAVRRTVAFAQAVFDGVCRVEEVTGNLTATFILGAEGGGAGGSMLRPLRTLGCGR